MIKSAHTKCGACLLGRGARSCKQAARTTPVWLALVILAASLTVTHADSTRPAYLEIVEQQPGLVDVVWKIPKVPGLPADLWPSLPASYAPSTPTEVINTPDAIVHKWSMAGDPLAGSEVSVAGLEASTTDTLLRIKLFNGRVHRTVLKPSQPSFRLPIGPEIKPWSRWPTKIWLYPTLLAAAWLISLTPQSRRRGILFCSLALLTGSICGHALGTVLPRPADALNEADAKRVLHGLMLNTYRACVLEEDEAAYDLLARSVDGPLLSDLFLLHRRVFSFHDPEAASSIVDRLDIKTIESIEANADGSVTLLTHWDVYGSVSHWDHVHFRCNSFKAEITLQPDERYWKIIALNILEEERVL